MITFRQMLKERESKGDTCLYSALEEMFQDGLTSWLSLLGEKDKSFLGIPHIQNVEKHIDNAVPDSVKRGFSSTEIFVLLASVLLHDIGKLEDALPHSTQSCHIIQKNWAFLRIPSYQLSIWISAVSCSHTWPTPFPPRLFERVMKTCPFQASKECELACEIEEFSELNLHHEAYDGPVRLDWIATLLRIGDEVDNFNRRTLPQWLVPDKTDVHWRFYINSIFFDLAGKCIKLRTRDFFDAAWDTTRGSDANEKSQREKAYEALKGIDSVLGEWKRPLGEIGLTYQQAFIESAKPRPTLFTYPDRDTNGSQHISTIEPPLTKNLIIRIIRAMLRLDYGVINGRYFSWESLSAESGLGDVGLVILAVNRIRATTSSPNIGATCTSGAQSGYIKKAMSDHKIISFSSGWMLERNEIEGAPKAKKYDSCTILTGIKELDYLLCPENPKPAQNHSRNGWKGGFYAPLVRHETDTCKWLSPVISVVGGSGDGKTSLAIQIATGLIRNEWLSIFYCLEQKPERIIQNMFNYGFMDSDDLKKYLFDLERIPWYHLSKNFSNDHNGGLLLPRLTPSLPEHSSNVDNLFELRYNEIKRSLEWFRGSYDKCTKLFFFIDSLSAFSDDPLTRTEIHQLFSLFRLYEVPLLITLERQRNWAKKEELAHYNIARYLTDVEIRLESGQDDGYFRHTIEVAKTRYNRRILGKHQLKLKSPRRQTTKGFDNRTGVVIYPSVHAQLSKKSVPKEVCSVSTLIQGNELPIGYKITGSDTGSDYVFDMNSCFVICGPHGGHKFALSLNILLNHKPAEAAKIKRKLIISMAEEREINLEGTALHEEVAKLWRDKLNVLQNRDGDNEDLHGDDTKIWVNNFGREGSDKNGEDRYTYVTVMNFRMGQMMTEEFLYIIDQYLNTCQDIDSVLFCDTAHVKNRFPSIANNALFMPTLVDMFKSKGLYSVFIDVQENQRYEQSLLASADCRIYVNHERVKKSQRVYFTVNNVRGKVYDQNQRKITVCENSGDPGVKTLKLTEEKKQTGCQDGETDMGSAH